MIRPLTPDEAEALSRPAVQACIRSIDDDLAAIGRTILGAVP